MSHTIPKRQVPIRLHLESGEVVDGVVFLDFIDVIHRGEQTLLDKFNDDYAWFPLKRATETDIVNRARVTMVEPGPGLPMERVRKEGEGIFRRESVTIHLAGPRTMQGDIAMDLPDEFCRASDFLNFPQEFFALDTEDGPVLVSKRHLLRLQAHEAPPDVPDAEGSGVERRA
jgi:hypothetical protein